MSKIINLSKTASILNQFLYEIRDNSLQQNKFLFRHHLKKISVILAYELSKHSTYTSKKINTPICETIKTSTPER